MEYWEKLLNNLLFIYNNLAHKNSYQIDISVIFKDTAD